MVQTDRAIMSYGYRLVSNICEVNSTKFQFEKLEVAVDQIVNLHRYYVISLFIFTFFVSVFFLGDLGRNLALYGLRPKSFNGKNVKICLVSCQLVKCSFWLRQPDLTLSRWQWDISLKSLFAIMLGVEAQRLAMTPQTGIVGQKMIIRYTYYYMLSIAYEVHLSKYRV